ncbi:RMD11 [Blastomyces dermatitidis ATCC 18188]|uniref:Nitrogen permease regulator 3 n=1 Tax=Ajellomyces dermatitidis (strain ATCC 18188 / CBS 674.68) TaxID=653446 RepID=F2TKV8_AJEDA|nr:RMD11 [Blastomyces dermatitidis ATCC 18188]
MSSIVRPPDPCLVAIILIIQSRAGPRFVYHYPPNPSTIIGSKSRRNSRRKGGAKSSESSPSSDDDWSSSDDEEDERGHSSAGGNSLSQGVSEHIGKGGLSEKLGDKNSHAPSARGHSVSSSVQFKRRSVTPDPKQDNQPDPGRGEDLGHFYQPPWESLLGLPTNVWEKLLSPPPSWHKRRFEVGLNDLVFVGWPVFVREDGTWRKRKKKKKKKKVRKQRPSGERQELGDDDKENGDQKNDIKQPSETEDDNDPVAEDQNIVQDPVPPGSPETDKDSMTMFNVVFVLNPPLLEYGLRVREKYENVIKKFGKGLKSEQARVDYVWKEARTIVNIKEKAKESKMSLSRLYSELHSKSSLARAISTVYTSISNSRIASVTLTPEATMSLQAPPLTSTSYLPSATEKAYPGLWLTTADSLSATDEATGMETSEPNQVLAKHFALLLLTDEATILKDIEGSIGPLGARLAHYIRVSKPTKSFAQISALSGIPLSDIQVLASHLVYWRRARAVPPLSQRDTYIVSPNADMSKLAQAAEAYEAAFPTLPSLPKMLHALSDTPKPYSRLIPSKDHKEIYYAILAWLLRGGWVTQLRTFGWVRVDPEIKQAVDEALEREKEEKELEERVRAASSTKADSKIDSKPVDDDGHDDNDDAESSSSSSLESEDSGEATPVPNRISNQQYNYDKYTETQKQKGRLYSSSLILRPHRASSLESHWLDEILSRFPEPSSQLASMDSYNAPSPEESIDADYSLQKYWPLFTKYFNGTDALEKIPVREGLNQKVVWRLLHRLDRSTPQLESGENVPSKEKVLVTVRHW